MRLFSGIGIDTVPDEGAILQFRRILERHDLGRTIFVEVAQHLQTQGLMLRK